MQVRDADKVIVIGGGRIVEQGTHDELLAADGAYKKLVKRRTCPVECFCFVSQFVCVL